MSSILQVSSSPSPTSKKMPPQVQREDYERVKAYAKEHFLMSGYRFLLADYNVALTRYKSKEETFQNCRLQIKKIIKKTNVKSPTWKEAHNKISQIAVAFMDSSSEDESLRLIGQHIEFFQGLKSDPFFGPVAVSFVDVSERFAIEEKSRKLSLLGSQSLARCKTLLVEVYSKVPKEDKPRVSMVVDRIQQELSPDLKSWRERVYYLNSFGVPFGDPTLGHDCEDLHFKIIARRANGLEFIYQRTPLTPEKKSVEAPSLFFEEPQEEDKENFEVVSNILPTETEVEILDPTLEKLITGFKTLALDPRITRWKGATFEVSPEPAFFPEYSEKDASDWKKDIVRHKMPYYLLLTLSEEELINLNGNKEKDTWVIPLTLELPGKPPILGRAEVSQDSKGLFYHNYFMADQKDDIANALKALKVFKPVDTFYNSSKDCMSHNYRFQVSDQTISMEDTSTGVRATFTKKVMLLNK